MSREVRRVPADWKHPERYPGRYEPLFEGAPDLDEQIEKWHEEKELWDKNEHPDQAKFNRKVEDCAFEDWNGGPPRPCDYMPWWPEEQKTHYQMYETCSEGTPISPVMTGPEELAHWLADHKASAFGDCTASYEDWLSMIRGPGWAPSGAIINTSKGRALVSGVVAMAINEESKKDD